MEQVEENCRIADNALPNSFTPQEQAVIEQVTALFNERIKIHCAACAYCMPCPSGVAIPLVFSTYNEAFRFDDPSSLIRYYQSLPPEVKADKCTACRECLSKCPHQIQIPEKMREIVDYFDGVL